MLVCILACKYTYIFHLCTGKYQSKHACKCVCVCVCLGVSVWLGWGVSVPMDLATYTGSKYTCLYVYIK